MSSKVVREKRISEKEIIEQIKHEDLALWNEVAEYKALLEEWGITGYKLTGPLEDPIVTSYQINMG